MSIPRHFTVVGGGIVGVCCALFLQRDGHTVTLIDRGEPGAGCSFGNAGIIHAGGLVPLAMPGVLRRIPAMLRDPLGPLVIRWPYLPRLAPFLWRFLLSARPARVEAVAAALAGLIERAFDSYEVLIKASGAERLIRRTGELYVFETDAGLATMQAANALRRRHGVRIETLSPGELAEMEPALAPIFRHARFFPDCISTFDPFDLTTALAAHFRTAGGTILREEVRDIRISEQGSRTLVTEAGERVFDGLVLATGAFSKPWAARLGSRVPLDTERGYHLILPDPGLTLGRPVGFGDRRFGCISLSGGLRVVGQAELASVDAPPNFSRADMLLQLVQRVLPDLDTRNARPWMGHRPSTPDSLPVICRAPKVRDVWFAFGHGHVGLTLGAVTGRLISDLVAGRNSGLDLSPFHVDRFAGFGRRPAHTPSFQSEGRTS
ncbi:FAD-binding oxidoreductase [Sinirhodobacter populi]|uniref:FAD-binding oxidoreductase n=1 Tax=Paenirhodobacter populi TaxID=2306993 RepID=A0A443K4G9_9RHOB|nr:FAD-binding oxidoreductase [Sinirhodobacter populi]RWR27677.1 FAD-binding oxidoreductase [Sinirhodobacter populi]